LSQESKGASRRKRVEHYLAEDCVEPANKRRKREPLGEDYGSGRMGI